MFARWVRFRGAATRPRLQAHQNRTCQICLHVRGLRPVVRVLLLSKAAPAYSFASEALSMQMVRLWILVDSVWRRDSAHTHQVSYFSLFSPLLNFIFLHYYAFCFIIRHFKLPSSVKKQKELCIVDHRNPNDFLEVITELLN